MTSKSRYESAGVSVGAIFSLQRVRTKNCKEEGACLLAWKSVRLVRGQIIYTLYSGYLLGISSFKGLLGGLNN